MPCSLQRMLLGRDACPERPLYQRLDGFGVQISCGPRPQMNFVMNCLRLSLVLVRLSVRVSLHALLQKFIVFSGQRACLAIRDGGFPIIASEEVT